MDIPTEDWHTALTSLINAGHTLPASGLAAALADTLRPMGIHTTVHLVDAEQRALRMLPQPGQPHQEPIPIDGSLAGRAYMLVTPIIAGRDPTRVWMPIVDGTERLGVLDITGVFPILLTVGYAACSRVPACAVSYSIGVS